MLNNDSAFPATAHQVYAQWRSSGRVHRMQTPDGHPVWVVTSYDDVRSLFTDERLAIDKRHARDGYTGFSLPPTLDANLLNVDPPDHTRLRRLVTAVFTSRRVQQMRPMVEKHVEQLLDKLKPRRQADLVAELAVPLPLAVIGELLGFDDVAQMRSWTDALIAPGAHQPHTPRQAITAMEQYIRDLIAQRRRQPDASLTSALIGVREGSDELTDDELTSLVFLLIWAGYETTIDALSTCLLSVLRQPALRDKLRDRPGDIEQAVEEMLRLDGPTPFSIRRFATDDITIGDSTIATGDTVLLLIAAANRDPHAFEEPDRQLIGRDPNPHLAFGRGVHHCLGAPLARLEIATTIAQLIRAFPAARLAVAPEELSWRPSFRARGLTELPVLLNG